MYSSPVRRFTNVLLRLLARLACLRRAASVHSEPGSNSHKGVLRIWTKGHHFNTLTPLLNILYLVVKEQRHSHASRALYSVHRSVSRDPFTKFGWVFPKTACPHRNTRTRLPRQEAQAPCKQVGRYQNSPRESSTISIHDEIIVKIHQSPVSRGIPEINKSVILSHPTIIFATMMAQNGFCTISPSCE